MMLLMILVMTVETLKVMVFYENLFAEKYDGVGNKQDLLLGT